MSDPEARGAVASDGVNEILRRRAESLATEHFEAADEQREDVLLFALGEETYGVRIANVREICNEYTVTPIPCVPDFILGVISIRGETVSLTDLARLLGTGTGGIHLTGDGELPPVIVVAEGRSCTALVVDSIGSIVEITAGGIEPPLAVADKVQSDFISGGFYESGSLVALVNTGKVLTPVGGE